MTLENAYSSDIFYYEDPTANWEEIVDNPNYEDELHELISNDKSEENMFDEETTDYKKSRKQKSEYNDEEETTDYKKTRKQRKQKTDEHLSEIFRY